MKDNKGNELWVQGMGKKITFRGKKVVLTTLRDINEIKNDEEKLKEYSNELQKLEEEHQKILDSVPAWIFYKDKNNRFIRVNKVFAEVMGMTKEQLEGKSMFDLYSKKSAESYWQDDKEVISSGQPKRNIIESVKIKNEILWVQTDKIPYRDTNDNIIGIIGFTVDITAIRISEEKIKYTKQLEKMNEMMVGRETKMVELKKR